MTQRCQEEGCETEIVSERNRKFCSVCSAARKVEQHREGTRRYRARMSGETYDPDESKPRSVDWSSPSNIKAAASIKPWMLERGTIHYEGYKYE